MSATSGDTTVRRIILRTVWLALAGGGLLASPLLHAAQCGFTTSGLAFGPYDPLAAGNDVASGSITVTCSALTGRERNRGFIATLALSTGSSGSYAARTLRSASDTLRYNLYLDAAYTTVFGDDTAGTQLVRLCYRGRRGDPCGGAGLAAGTPHTVPVYGRIPASQDVASGGFIDNLVATVSF